MFASTSWRCCSQHAQCNAPLDRPLRAQPRRPRSDAMLNSTPTCPLTPRTALHSAAAHSSGTSLGIPSLRSGWKWHAYRRWPSELLHLQWVSGLREHSQVALLRLLNTFARCCCLRDAATGVCGIEFGEAMACRRDMPVAARCAKAP